MATEEKTQSELDEEAIEELRAYFKSQEGFVVKTQEEANWVLSKMVAAAQEAASTKSWAARRVKYLTNRVEGLKTRFQSELKLLCENELGGGSKKKSLALPNGKIGFTSKGKVLKVVDEESLIQDLVTSEPLPVKVSIEITGIDKVSLSYIQAVLDKQQEDMKNRSGCLMTYNVKENYSKEVLNAVFNDDGVVHDGCEVVPEHEEFFVRPNKPAKEEEPCGLQTNL